jgi:hypothetical protein
VGVYEKERREKFEEKKGKRRKGEIEVIRIK